MASTEEYERREREKCTSKKRFYLESDAKEEAAYITKKFKKCWGKQRAYHCPWCDGWHLTRRKKNSASTQMESNETR